MNSVSDANAVCLRQKKCGLLERNFSMAAPFLGYVGPKYNSHSSGPKIMYIGKATNSWDDGAVEDAGAEADEFIRNGIVGQRYNGGQFWRFIIDMVPRLYNETPKTEYRKWVMDRIIWTNIAKLGAKEGNPSGSLFNWQKSLCKKILAKEMTDHKPNCILLVTGGWQMGFIYDLFGPEKDWCKVNHDLWIKNLPENYGPGRIYWTRHPQGWKLCCREGAKATIINDFRNFLGAA